MKSLELINTQTPIKTLTIVGTGNVATHLYKAYSSLLDVTQVNSRTLEGLPDYSDVILICVKDDAIENVARPLTGKARILVHTSGSVPMTILEPYAENYGVFYPLQTFSKNKELSYKDIPFFLEGNSPDTLTTLERIALMVSPNVFEADSERRKRLHVAAVFACNFANHLVGIADDLLHEEGMDHRVLLPLLKETVGKLETLAPNDAQTGPAVRNDRSVMARHEAMLTAHPEWLDIYRLLSKSIIERHKSND